MAISSITSAQFQQEVLNSPIPVLVEFYATWCGPCKIMAPVLDEIAQAVAGKAKVVKIDVDQEQKIAGRYRVMSIPTMFVFKEGAVTAQWRGVQSKETLIQALTA
ncbi:thioredoxin [Candidatus Uhrbacteria bacterium]|nr:thioredoxin [Candidatus Uhrbacteria bacterium]